MPGPLQMMHECRDDARARASQGMPKRNRATAGINDFVVDFKQIDNRQNLRSKSFIDLDGMKIVDAKSISSTEFFCGRYRAYPHNARIHTSRLKSNDPGKRHEPIRFRKFARRDHYDCGTIVET